MTDIRIAFDPIAQMFDAVFAGEDLATDEGLETAIYVSLFTDRRANDDDVLPDGSTDRRGWWGDALSDVADDKIGSRLWLLKRSKLTAEVVRLARDYCDEALRWLVEDGIARTLDITAERHNLNTIAVQIIITKPDGSPHKFDYLWSAI